jgi:putative addiction module component (TIGR02574 family)
MSTVPDVFNAALSLAPQERSELAHQLLLSLDPANDEENVEQAWADEIRRRLQAIRSGQATLCDWDETLTVIRQEISLKGSA